MGKAKIKKRDSRFINLMPPENIFKVTSLNLDWLVNETLGRHIVCFRIYKIYPKRIKKSVLHSSKKGNWQVLLVIIQFARI